jgi:hypothetical protein
MTIRLFALSLLFPATLTVRAGERLTLAVSPLQSFAPTNLIVQVHVAPDDANRALEITADSSEYYRSSRIQLDGKDAPRTITSELRSLPGGDYDVGVVLIDSAGHARAFAHQAVRILSSAGGD